MTVPFGPCAHPVRISNLPIERRFEDGGPIGQDHHSTCLALIFTHCRRASRGLVGDATASDRVDVSHGACGAQGVVKFRPACRARQV